MPDRPRRRPRRRSCWARTGSRSCRRKDPRGDTWDLRVRDEQSIPNLWSAPPFLIAASLGRTVHTGDLKPDDTEIDLEDGKDFPEQERRDLDRRRADHLRDARGQHAARLRARRAGRRAPARRTRPRPTCSTTARASSRCCRSSRRGRRAAGASRSTSAAAKEITLYGETERSRRSRSTASAREFTVDELADHRRAVRPLAGRSGSRSTPRPRT